MGVADITADLEPLLGLIIGLEAGGDTLVTGVLDDTVLVEVVDAGIITGPAVTTVYIDVVFLTE